MPDDPSTPNPDFLAEYTLQQAEAEREEAEARATFEARFAAPARQLRPEWDAAWATLCRLLGPVWSVIRGVPDSNPLPDSSILAAALKPVGEALARLNPIREARLEVHPSLHDFTLRTCGIPPRPTDRLARVRDEERFRTPAPRAAAYLLVRAAFDSIEELTECVRALLADDVLRVAFGWLPFMRDCIWPQPTPRHPGLLQPLDPREDPIGPGPACNDWRQQICVDDYRRVEILLAGEIPIGHCDLFPEWDTGPELSWSDNPRPSSQLSGQPESDSATGSTPAPASNGTERDEGEKSAADAYADLRVFARDLSKQERAVVEALCDADGELSLADIKTLCEWEDPIDSAWNSLRRRLNKKLEPRGWRVLTKGRAARLTKPGAG